MGGLIQSDCVLVKSRSLDLAAHRENSWNMKAEAGVILLSTSQGTPDMARKSPEAGGQAQNRSFPQPSEGNDPADTSV